MKSIRITKANWRKVIKDLKKQDTKVHTVRGAIIHARDANFRLVTRPCGKYTLLCNKKKQEVERMTYYKVWWHSKLMHGGVRITATGPKDAKRKFRKLVKSKQLPPTARAYPYVYKVKK